MAQPTDLPRWSTDVGTTTEPTEDKKDEGFVAGEKPAAQTHNWLFNTIYLWCDYLKNLTSEALTWTATQLFNVAGANIFTFRETTASLSEDPTAVTTGNTVKFRGSGTISGGVVSEESMYACSLSTGTSGGVGFIQVTFDSNFTSFGTSYEVLLDMPLITSMTTTPASNFTIYRPRIAAKTTAGFAIAFERFYVDLSGNTAEQLSTDLNSLTALGTARFSFVVFQPLVSYSITV